MPVHESLSDSSRRKCAACLEKFNGRIFYDLKFIKEGKKIIRKKMLNATYSKMFRYFISL